MTPDAIEAWKFKGGVMLQREGLFPVWQGAKSNQNTHDADLLPICTLR